MLEFFLRSVARRGLCFVVALHFLVVSSFGASAEHKAFRFAWLSDTHIGDAVSIEDLERSIADINAQSNLSFVIISGDVTQFGFEEQYEVTKSVLSKLRVPCHAIPGNHDCKWSDNAGTLFSKYFGSDRFVFDLGGYRFIGMHQGPVLKMGDGHFAPQDVRWLDATLSAVPKNQPIIFVTHYPLDDGIDNWFVVLDRLKQCNTQAVLVGHGHGNRAMNYEGVPAAMGRSNLRAGQPVGGYTVVTVENGVMTMRERNPGGAEKAPWNSIKLKKHNYAAQTKEWPRPDFSGNSKYPFVKTEWQLQTGWTIASSPAVANKSVYVGDASGALRAYDLETGKQQWEFKTDGPIYSTPYVADGIVVFSSTDSSIYGVDAASGSKIWQHQTAKPSVGAPLVDHGIVYVGASDRKFRALDLKTGKPIWEFGGLRGFVEARPLLYDGKIIFGAWDAYLYALDQKTGELAWKWIGDKKSDLYSPAACWPVGANGKVFIVAPDRKATALDAATGKQVWRTDKWMVRESIGLSEDQTRVYMRTMQDHVVAVSASASNPEQVWDLEAKFGYDINSAMLVEKDGILFYGTKNGLLLAMNAKTGNILWQHKLGNSIINTVVPMSATRVVLTDFDGKVTMLSAKQ